MKVTKFFHLKFFRLAQCLWLLMLAVFAHTQPHAHELTIDFKSVKLSTEKRASLKQFLASQLPDRTFDWNTLEAHSQSVGGKRQPLTVTISTVPASSSPGICRSEQHRFYFDGASKQWQANEERNSYSAWPVQGNDCTAPSTPIAVGKSLTDADFLYLDKQRDALKSRAAQVIGGSDCARVRFCEITLRRIDRVREEYVPGKSRILTKLTYSPAKPGTDCLYAMELSFVGPLNELVPRGASCPLP